ENGSLALAEAGLLDEHAAAVHWDNLAGFQELFPRIRIAQAGYSFSKRRVTCAGAAAILDLMVAWVGQHADPELSLEIGRHLLLRTSAPGTADGSDALIERARGLMRANVDDPISCDALAERLSLSLRQLERRFRQALGHTLHTEYMLVRVE